jgi:hypothetical protein
MKRFIIPFESGIVVIKHWKIHNYIRNDRYKATVYTKEKAMLTSKENGAYTEMETSGIPSGNQAVYQMDTQVSIGKDSIDKVSLVEGSSITAATTTNNETVENSVGNSEDDTDIEPPDYDVLKPIGGVGKNVVVLSDRQIDTLLEIIIDIDIFNSYVEKLATFIISKSANVKNHYKMILKWYKEDSSVSN